MQHLFLALIFITMKSIRAFSHIGYEIKDLQETEFALFQKEAEHWKIFFEEKLFKTLISNSTEGKLILGDPNVLKLCDPEGAFIYFERIYTGLPPHQFVTLTGKFWHFGDGSEELKSYIGVLLGSRSEIPSSFSKIKPEAQFQAENQLYEVKFGDLNARALHEGSELYLTITFYKELCHGKPDSLGIREITLHLNDELPDKYPESGCVRSQEALNLKNYVCSCPFGQGFNGNLDCQSCAPNCLDCFESDPRQCVQCSSGTSWRGNECNSCQINCKGCTGPSFNECLGCNGGVYDYGNGTCLETCEWPFQKVETRDGNKLCVQYCESKNEFLWKEPSQSANCRASCRAPLVPFIDNNGILICQNPCVNGRDFLYPNGSCIATCPVPLVAEFESSSRFCKNPCKSTSDYLYANRSCLGGCPAPLQKRIEPIANFCVNPCHDKSSYLYQNGSCLRSCLFPLKTREEFGAKYCLPPCQLTGEYILSDGSCSVECPASLARKTVVSVGTFCLNPCETADYFISGNGSCLSNCPDYFKIKKEYGVKYCLSPCLAEQYYFAQNKSCLGTCPYPFKVTSEEGINLCKNPCSKAKPFLYDDQSCHEGCPMPLVIKEGSSCKSPCLKENEYINKDRSCQESCEYPETVIEKVSYKICMIDEERYQMTKMSRVRKIIKMSNSLSEIMGIFSHLINSGDPTSILMMPLLNMFEQISLIETKLPVGMGEISTRLSENLDHNLRKLGITCLIYFLLTGIKILSKENRRSQISRLLHSIWSILTLVMISTNGNALLYIFLTDDFKNPQWTRILGCLIVILFTIFVIYRIIRIKRNIHQEQQAGLSSYPERWRFLFETYRSDGIFMLIYIVRMTFVSFVVGCLSESPELQTIIILLMSIGMLLYLILASPITKKVSCIQHFVIEIGLLLYNGVFVILAVFNIKDEDAILGQLMMILYLVTSLITALLILMKFLFNIYNLLFKPQDRLQGDHIQLREFSQNSEGDDGERNENFEQQQQQRRINEISFEEINQEDYDAEDNEIEADVVIE